MMNLNNVKKELFLKRMIPFAIIVCMCIILSFVIDSLIHPIKEQKIKSDVIVVLGGDEGRLEKAVELYKQGYASKILLSPISPLPGGLSISEANKLGIPREAILVESGSSSTRNTIYYLNNIMINYNFKSAIIVTSDYHMRRTMMTFDKYKSSTFTIHYVSALDLKGRKWYERPDKFKIWYTEFKRLTGYRLHLYKFIDE